MSVIMWIRRKFPYFIWIEFRKFKCVISFENFISNNHWNIFDRSFDNENYFRLVFGDCAISFCMQKNICFSLAHAIFIAIELLHELLYTPPN